MSVNSDQKRLSQAQNRAQTLSKHKQGIASTVLPNKRQAHERLPETLLHKSTTFIRNEKGEIVKVRSSTYESGREPSPTPKQRAKATKAMMKARGE